MRAIYLVFNGLKCVSPGRTPTSVIARDIIELLVLKLPSDKSVRQTDKQHIFIEMDQSLEG